MQWSVRTDTLELGRHQVRRLAGCKIVNASVVRRLLWQEAVRLRLLWPGWLRFRIKIDPAPPKLPATRLSEDLVHYLGTLSERRADLMPVHKFGCGRAVVSGQQRDALYRHSVRRQHLHERVPHLPGHPVLPEPGDPSDDSERPDHVVRTQRRADSRREYQAMVLPQLPCPSPVICLL